MAYAVTFRNNNETLTSMFSEKFRSVVDAKSANPLEMLINTMTLEKLDAVTKPTK